MDMFWLFKESKQVMTTYLYKPNCPQADKNGMVTKDEWYLHLYMHQEDKRMMVGNEPVILRYIGDEMDPTRHMASGRYHTSKKKFREETKAYGCVEVGNESPIRPKSYVPTTSREKLRQDIRQGIRSLKDNTLPPQEAATIKTIGKQVDYQNRNRRRTK